MTHTTTSFNQYVLEWNSFYIKLYLGDVYIWMCDVLGGDSELESQSQGWSRDSSFAQETGAKFSRSQGLTVLSLYKLVQDAR